MKVNGVEFQVKRKTYTAKVSREVILSAGAIQTPQILELSGIGDPDILTKAGIRTIIKNVDVGANLQDHLLTGMSYTLASGVASFDSLHDPALQAKAIAEYTASQTGPLR